VETRPIEGSDLVLEVDGPNVHPNTVDSTQLLALASSYLELLQKMGSEDDRPIKFTGLQIKDKCVAVYVQPDDSGLARSLADVSSAYLAERRLPQGLPQGLTKSIREVQHALRSFPHDHRAKVMVGTWGVDLALPDQIVDPDPAGAVESFRGKIVRVGGKAPKFQVQPAFEETPFSVDVTVEVAQKLAENLYGEVDLVVEIFRSSKGRVYTAKLLEFAIVSDRDPTEAWREWFKPHAQYWDQVDDLEEELTRDRSR
jgi:hypothetical protein